MARGGGHIWTPPLLELINKQKPIQQDNYKAEEAFSGSLSTNFSRGDTFQSRDQKKTYIAYRRINRCASALQRSLSIERKNKLKWSFDRY